MFSKQKGEDSFSTKQGLKRFALHAILEHIFCLYSPVLILAECKHGKCRLRKFACIELQVHQYRKVHLLSGKFIMTLR